MTDRPTMTVTTPGVGDEQIPEEIQLPPQEFGTSLRPPRRRPWQPHRRAPRPRFCRWPNSSSSRRSIGRAAFPSVSLGRAGLSEIVLRKLSGAQLRPFAELVSAGGDNADFAGFLSGLPGAVIRGLEATDAWP